MSDSTPPLTPDHRPVPFLRGLAHLLDLPHLALILRHTRRHTRRHRRLPAAQVVALVIALALFARDSVAKVWRRLHPSDDRPDPDPSAFAHARRRLGVAPLRELFRHLATPIATPATRGAFHRRWRLMAIDGTILDLPDSPANDRVFGRRRNQRGPDPFPQLRLLALCESGTHAICDLVLRPVRHAEPTMIAPLLAALPADALLLLDRGLFSTAVFQAVRGRGGHLLARVKSNRKLRRERVLADGSWRSHIYATDYDRRRERNGIPVRVIEWTHNDPTRPGCGQTHRLITSVLDPTELPAEEAVAVYHERWEQELVFDEWKTHLLAGRDPTLRSRTPRGVVQEVYGLAVAHWVVRRVMAEAAGEREDPDRLSFLDTVRVVQCRLPEAVGQSAGAWYAGLLREVGRQRLRPRRERWYPRVMKRPAKKWPPKRPHHHRPPQPTQPFRLAVVIT